MYMHSVKPPNHDDSCSLWVNSPYYRLQPLLLTTYYQDQWWTKRGWVGRASVKYGANDRNCFVFHSERVEDWRIWWQEATNSVSLRFKIVVFCIEGWFSAKCRKSCDGTRINVAFFITSHDIPILHQVVSVASPQPYFMYEQTVLGILLSPCSHFSLCLMLHICSVGELGL